MSEERIVGTYSCAMPVTFEPTEFELEMLERETLREWLDQVVRIGGWPCGDPPTIDRVDNPSHGLIMTDEDGAELLGEDGEVLRDPLVFTLIARGRALKPIADDPRSDVVRGDTP
jgi:hypothetical protein